MEYVSQIRQQNSTNNTSPNGTSPRPSARVGVERGDVHQLMMIIAWMVAVTVGLWALAFRQYKCAVWIHLFCMSFVNIIAWMSGFMIFIQYGTNSRIGQFHTWWGITVLILSMLQFISGIILWTLQKLSNIMPSSLLIFKWLHRIFGFIVLVFSIVQILVIRFRILRIFIPVVVISGLSLLFYILYKLLRPKMNTKSGLFVNNSLAVPTIHNSQQLLSRTNGQYFIFADKVYSLFQMLTNHPGGYQVVKSIRQRQIDRYMYGSQPLQSFVKMPIHHHTATSIKLAGQPIGVLSSYSPYLNMFQVNTCYLHNLSLPSKNKYIYTPYLASTNKQLPFAFQGYQYLSQLGKYFSLSINDKITRLYSIVNFLNQQNIQLMSKIAGKDFQGISQFDTKPASQTSLTLRSSVKSPFQAHTIPLLIKKYVGGKLTQQFLHRYFKGSIKLSKPLGRGLSLHQIPHGQIMLFAGGTGLNPFCDLIDLLYKQYLVSQKHQYSSQIIRLNPIVSEFKLLGKYLPTLFYSVHDNSQIPQLTAFQLNQLAQHGVMNVYVRSSPQSSSIAQTYPFLQNLPQRFEYYASNIASRLQKISQIYVCGPPAMNRIMQEAFSKNNIPNFRYRIL